MNASFADPVELDKMDGLEEEYRSQAAPDASTHIEGRPMRCRAGIGACRLPTWRAVPSGRCQELRVACLPGGAVVEEAHACRVKRAGASGSSPTSRLKARPVVDSRRVPALPTWVKAPEQRGSDDNVKSLGPTFDWASGAKCRRFYPGLRFTVGRGRLCSLCQLGK